MKTEFDVIIVGAGLVGLTTALCCAETGLTVGLMDRKAVTAGGDGRASALSASSLRLMENLGLDLSSDVQPIRDMLVTEGTPDSPWRLHFEGDGDGGDLGGLIENQKLKAALLAKVKATKSIQIIAPLMIVEATHTASGVNVSSDVGNITAKLLIAADGRESALRRKAGINVQRFDYDACSLVTTIVHELPHDGLAWQRFLPGGPLAVLPLTEQHSQIVWSGPTAQINAAEALEAEDFLALLFEKMDGYLGELELAAPRVSWPLRLQVADQFTADRLALVGDAAHVIHPLAGQGLNLGLRDAAALADGLKAAKETGQDIGVAGLLDYESARNSDTRLMGATTHALANLYRINSPAFGHARRLGLALTNRSEIITSALRKEAAGKTGSLPELMRRPF